MKELSKTDLLVANLGEALSRRLVCKDNSVDLAEWTTEDLLLICEAEIHMISRGMKIEVHMDELSNFKNEYIVLAAI